MVEEKSALTILREVEAKATSEELSRAVRELELDEREAEDELKQQLHVSETRLVGVLLVVVVLLLCSMQCNLFILRRLLYCNATLKRWK